MEASDRPSHSLSKLKWSKVMSAVRTFPEGCGYNVQSQSSFVAGDSIVSAIRDSPLSCGRNSFKFQHDDCPSGLDSGKTVTRCNAGRLLDHTSKVTQRNDFAVHTKDKQYRMKRAQISNTFRYIGENNDPARERVRKALRIFQLLCRILSQEEERTHKRQKNRNRVDLKAARILKDNGSYVSSGNKIVGNVPGVAVGDEFHYKMELNIVGLHHPVRGGIDYVKRGHKILATSIVTSGNYDDDTSNANFLIYTGSGGNVMDSKKEPEDQKLERGNLALKNSADEQNPVRVIRKETANLRAALCVTYTYDGLYLVEKCWQESGNHGKLVFKFLLRRVAGQPDLSWKKVRNRTVSIIREGLYINDISRGRETSPVAAVNTVDDEKPPSFKYTTCMIYPNLCASPPKSCDCKNDCSDFDNLCACEETNGGISYDSDGALVRAKPLVYECGPSCKCPPACHNRVSQHGIKFRFEIFKTLSSGWGVRSLNSIPSGSFVCEYVGELLTEEDAERRTGNSDYLFDIGIPNGGISLWDEASDLFPCGKPANFDEVKYCGFTVDASEYGNVGRFINHSCSPNLYVQYVLYDHKDKRFPHVMFFAAENIPPLHELTYHYNFSADEQCHCKAKMKKRG